MNSDTAFTGSLPNVYDANLGPLFFAPYAEELGGRVAALQAHRVLELAAGTGIATAAIAGQLPDAHIEATDLNAEMVLLAQSRRRLPAVRWSVADAMALPFEDDAFDLVACQFGVMFFPDRRRAFRETRRVLEPGGVFLFSVWDSLEHNDVARIVSAAAAASFPDDQPRFIERTPHGHSDPAPIVRDLADAGFGSVTYEAVTRRSCAPSARDAAVGMCEGTPLRNEINARDPKRLRQVVDSATRALEGALGLGAIEGKMRAFFYKAI
jgi:ubiquinone/menaquinone biosynthesis C-methylase UbiE